MHSRKTTLIICTCTCTKGIQSHTVYLVLISYLQWKLLSYIITEQCSKMQLPVVCNHQKDNIFCYKTFLNSYMRKSINSCLACPPQVVGLGELPPLSCALGNSPMESESQTCGILGPFQLVHKQLVSAHHHTAPDNKYITIQPVMKILCAYCVESSCYKYILVYCS